MSSCVLQWLETFLSTALRKRSGEERQVIGSKFGLQNSQPLVCFALCTGAVSDPMVISCFYHHSFILYDTEMINEEVIAY